MYTVHWTGTLHVLDQVHLTASSNYAGVIYDKNFK